MKIQLSEHHYSMNVTGSRHGIAVKLLIWR